MTKCEACEKELPAPGDAGAVLCAECIELFELELELELARGLSEHRCVGCNRPRPNWKFGDRCGCGARTVVIVEVSRAN